MKEKIRIAISRWNLTEMKVIYENTNKAVYSAYSADYGSVILKINHNTLQLSEEYKMLNALNGNGCCKVFGYDAGKGILLEERLIPGMVLREEEVLSKRIQVFEIIFHKIHIEASCLEVEQDEKTQSYLNWLENSYQFCKENAIEKN